MATDRNSTYTTSFDFHCILQTKNARLLFACSCELARVYMRPSPTSRSRVHATFVSRVHATPRPLKLLPIPCWFIHGAVAGYHPVSESLLVHHREVLSWFNNNPTAVFVIWRRFPSPWRMSIPTSIIFKPLSCPTTSFTNNWRWKVRSFQTCNVGMLG